MCTLTVASALNLAFLPQQYRFRDHSPSVQKEPILLLFHSIPSREGSVTYFTAPAGGRESFSWLLLHWMTRHISHFVGVQECRLNRFPKVVSWGQRLDTFVTGESASLHRPPEGLGYFVLSLEFESACSCGLATWQVQSRISVRFSWHLFPDGWGWASFQMFESPSCFLFINFLIMAFAHISVGCWFFLLITVSSFCIGG